ncbi:hypothetical protein FPE01S_01_01810 [Flavihumibacter petaseus NBRC 106054]|uniref:Redoxin domain-containing protein n=2 Tax=Flavihumibacter TaxID=1004301 RepID=A0A0E9MUC3_9BACT|nr:hypothetical protein FPE01S_01_01810 [Flavihumibacter petaseus NBRC 106054]
MQQMKLRIVAGGTGKTLFQDHKAVAFLFLSPDCPLCKNYGVVLQKINDAYSSRVQMIGIIPGAAYSDEEIIGYMTKYHIDFPVVIDPKFKLSSYLKATVTPEAILLDPDGWSLYRGAIDDWVVTLGRKKLRPENEYLKTAIDQYITHQPIQVKQTAPKGCLINEF